MFTRKIYYLLSPRLRYLGRRIFYAPADFMASFRKEKDEICPPKGMIFIGGGDFKKIGENYLSRFIELGNLQPGDRILDVGCGIGRIAIPLTKYLNNEGSYEGFDIVKFGIKWCRKHISVRYPNFIFRHIDLRNDLYNLKTTAEAKTYSFPYPDGSFDFIILTSVFTHMLPGDMIQYLHQIRRVIRKNGKCYLTLFLLNEESRPSMASHDGLDFRNDHGYYRTLNDNVREANVAYDENYLFEKILPETKFKVGLLKYGFWSGRPKEESLDFQDTLILYPID